MFKHQYQASDWFGAVLIWSGWIKVVNINKNIATSMQPVLLVSVNTQPVWTVILVRTGSREYLCLDSGAHTGTAFLLER